MGAKAPQPAPNRPIVSESEKNLGWNGPMTEHRPTSPLPKPPPPPPPPKK